MPPDFYFPPAFSETLRQLPIADEEREDFVRAHQQTPPVSLRLNKGKPSTRFADDERVAWCSQGRYLPMRPRFTSDPLLHAGAYYVQEASSMLLCHIVQQVCDLSSPLTVLDACAAPGGKSTLLINLLNEQSLLLANEMVRQRSQVLAENLIKWGNPYTFVTCNAPEQFAALKGMFDLLVIDAPCSGEGLFRKDETAHKQWSPELVRHCAIRQEKILNSLAPTLAPQGILLYSTCTYEPAENEAQIMRLLETGDFESIEIDMPIEWGITTKIGTLPNGMRWYAYQCYPHRVKGEGFFVSILKRLTQNCHETKRRTPKSNANTTKKLSEQQKKTILTYLHPDIVQKYILFEEKEEIFALPKVIWETWNALHGHLYFLKQGILMGKWNGKELLPSPELALSTALNPNLPCVDLDKNQALAFLQKHDICLPESTPTGWLLAKHEQHALGWLKNLGNRSNNYYPKEWKIMKA